MSLFRLHSVFASICMIGVALGSLEGDADFARHALSRKGTKKSLDDGAVYLNKVSPSKVLSETEVHGFVDHPKSWSGFVTVDEKNGGNLFYWLFDSLNGDEKAPLIVWLQGGPGCSSLLGLMMENGPRRIQPDGSTKPNPYAWMNKYRVLYVDNPIGTGWSYVNDEAGYLDNQPAVADELYHAVSMVLSKYEHLHGVEVYVAGESYSGKWVPSVAHRIHVANKKAKAADKVNLKGIAIGDGMSDPISQVSTYADFAYQTSLIDLKEKHKVEKKQRDILDSIKGQDFASAWSTWDDVINGILSYAGGASSYDIRSYSKLDIKTPAAYIKTLGPKLHVGGHRFQACNHKVYHHMKEDMMKSVLHLFPELIKNYRVLIYHGQWDLVCNAPGINKLLARIDWDGKGPFAEADRKIWKVHGKPAGFLRSHGHLAQLTIVNAGHMVPMDRAEVGFRMMRRFVQGEGFGAEHD